MIPICCPLNPIILPRFRMGGWKHISASPIYLYDVHRALNLMFHYSAPEYRTGAVQSFLLLIWCVCTPYAHFRTHEWVTTSFSLSHKMFLESIALVTLVSLPKLQFHLKGFQIYNKFSPQQLHSLFHNSVLRTWLILK